MKNKKPRIVILQKSLPQYRVAFFNGLREELAKREIDLELIYGDMDEGRKDKVKLDWATFLPNKYLNLRFIKLIWQPCLKQIRNADLVIVEQADKLLLNYFLFIRKIFGRQRFAFWGQGRHLQDKENSAKNLFKRIFLKHCNWWFAYTTEVKDYLIRKGYPGDRVTVVQNAIDTRWMQEDYLSITEQELNQFREAHKISKAETVLIYCGSLFKEKRIEFLTDAAKRLFEDGYKIRLLVVGAGPDEQLIVDAAAKYPFISYAGPLFGRNKAVAFKASSLFLLPGAIGLAVLDSFAYRTPIVTTVYEFHGAEFKYIINGENGVITENDPDAYLGGIKDILNNKELSAQLVSNCIRDAGKYTNENMVLNFADGISSFIGETSVNR
jgi:glycosyltransferase involved in cell wall biosynthesis